MAAPETFGTREVGSDGQVRIPSEALEQSDVEPGGNVMVGVDPETGTVVLVPWGTDDIRSMMSDE